MNPKYVEAMKEIQHLATSAILEDQDAFAGSVFMLIIEQINAAMDGTPSMKPIDPAKVIPHDEPAAEVPRTEAEIQKQRATKHFSFCNGVFPIRRANTEEGVMQHVWIDGRRFTMDVVVVNVVEGINRMCEFTIRDNGQIKISGRFYGGKSNAEKVAHMALKGYVKQFTGASKFHSRGGFLKQALKRLQAKEAANG